MSEGAMRRLAWMGIGVIAAVAASCGYPDFQFETMCDVLHGAADCGSGQRCTIVDPVKGTTGCSPASTSAHPYDACSSDASCPSGTWCDGRTGVCMLFCQSSSDCGGNDCVSAYYVDKGGMPHTIPGGASVCVANCDPVSAVPCGTQATCAYDGNIGAMDCFITSGDGLGQSCMFLNDCGPGLACVGTCQTWCHPAGGTSADCAGGTCMMFSNLAPMYEGQVYGICQ